MNDGGGEVLVNLYFGERLWRVEPLGDWATVVKAPDFDVKSG